MWGHIMKKTKNKLCFISLALGVVLMLVGCGMTDDGSVIEDVNKDITTTFFSDQVSSNEVNVFFLDIDNINSGTETERTYQSNSSTNVGSCDCYMIKVGNTEILVDCGYQTFASDACTKEEAPYTFTYQYLKNNVHNNLLRKITSICTDGTLDYLIVTHSDFDHIASLCVEGGVVDSFVNHETIDNLENDKVTLNGITNVIDFNSGVIALHSYSKIDKDKRLCRALYQTYLAKMEKLINSGTNYLPAAALFDSHVIAADGTSMTQKNKLLATPKNMLDNVNDYFSQRILTEDQPNDAASEYVNEVPKNSSYLDNVTKLGGQLQTESEKYYYSVNIGSGAELRILYNWYYDFAYRQSFSDGQPLNNPSVCFEVVKNDFKFLSCGDMGGNGESGLLNYYNDTTVLKNVTLFKASHHGTTQNNENSKALFKCITPQIIVVTGCAQSPMEIKNPKSAYMRQAFFDNIYNGIHDENLNLINNLTEEPYILCTNIDWFRSNESNNIPINESKPFYGDIHVSIFKSKVHLNYSYKGTIHAFIKTGSSDDTIDFKTVDGNKIIKIQDTEWFKKVGFVYEGN